MEVEPTFAFDPAPPATIMAGDTGHFRVNIIEVTGSRNRLTTGVTSSAESVVRINLEGDRWRYTGILAGRAEILGLTPAEGQVAVWLAEGKSVRDMAEATGHTEGAIYWHLKQIYRKHSISRQVDLVRLVLSLAELG